MNNNEDIMCEHKNYTRLEEFEPNCFTCVCLDCGEKFVKIINPITNNYMKEAKKIKDDIYTRKDVCDGELRNLTEISKALNIIAEVLVDIREVIKTN
jgi:Mg2+ and Co2+ transporter CorA